MDYNLVIASVILVGLAIGVIGMGRSSNRLARMEIAAMVNVAKQEVGWEYERYRIEWLRMTWLTMPLEARREYTRRFGAPRWAGDFKEDPLAGIDKVRIVRSALLSEATA